MPIRQVDFNTSIQTSAPPTVSTPINDEDLVTKGYSDDTYTPLTAYDLAVANNAALKAIAAANRSDKEVRLNTGAPGGAAFYRFDSGNADADDGDLTLAPDVGSGRWKKIIGTSTGFTKIMVTGTSQSISVSTIYVANHASTRINFSLPATSAFGDEFVIVGYGNGSYRITQAAGQQIFDLQEQTLLGTAGELRAIDPKDSVHLICLVANTIWAVYKKNVEYGYVSNRTRAYLAGGSSAGPATAYDTIFKFDFIAETGANIAATLGVAREGFEGIRSQTKGYFAGGNAAGPTAEDDIDDINFASDTSATLAAVLTSIRYGTGGWSAPLVGFWYGGSPDNGASVVATVDKFTYSSEVVTAAANNLVTAMHSGTSMFEKVRGWRLGGIIGGGTELSSIEAYNFAEEIGITIQDALASTKYDGAGLSSKYHGYYAGGLDTGGGDAITTIEKLDFRSQAIETISVVLDLERAFACGVSSTVAGYIAGGYPDSTTTQDDIQKLDFITEAMSTIAETLDANTRQQAGVEA